MLQLTPEATRHLRRVRDERGMRDHVPRLVGNGALVGFTFVDEPEPDDQRIESDGLDVYLASDIAGALDQSVLDARTDDGANGSTNGNATGTVLVVRLQPGATFAPTSA